MGRLSKLALILGTIGVTVWAATGVSKDPTPRDVQREELGRYVGGIYVAEAHEGENRLRYSPQISRDIDGDGSVDLVTENNHILWYVPGFEHNDNGGFILLNKAQEMTPEIREALSRGLSVDREAAYLMARERFRAYQKSQER